jgi:hypothetical protein
MLRMIEVLAEQVRTSAEDLLNLFHLDLIKRIRVRCARHLWSN